MRNQLIGWKRPFTKTPRQTTNYPAHHICSLPPEILDRVVLLLPLKALLALAATCTKLYKFVCKKFLYQDVVLKSPLAVALFASHHLPSGAKPMHRIRSTPNEASKMINYIQSVHFVNPPSRVSPHTTIKIVGTYDVGGEIGKNDPTSFMEWSESVKVLCTECFGLKTLTITDISPSFAFESFDDTHVLSLQKSLSFWKKTKTPKRSLQTLVLKAQSGWLIPFKFELLAGLRDLFSGIEHLVLHNFIIDDMKLVTEYPNAAAGLAVNRLTLHSCLYHPTLRKSSKPRVNAPLFSQVNALTMNNILSMQDLSLIDFIRLNRKLAWLGIDMASPVFYHKNAIDVQPQFNYQKFNLFFKLVGSKNGTFNNLCCLELSNFDLLSGFAHLHEQKHDTSIADSRETMQELFLHISKIANLIIRLPCKVQRIHTCKKCGFKESVERDKDITSLLAGEWSILLHSVISNNERCNIQVYDYKNILLFQTA